MGKKNGSKGNGGVMKDDPKAYSSEEKDELVKNLKTIYSRISKADNSVWLDKIRLGLILYHARIRLENNFYRHVDEEVISKKTVQRYTRMVLDTASAELYGVKGTDFNTLTVDKRLEKLVGYDSSKGVFDDSIIDSSNHGEITGLLTKTETKDGKEIKTTEETTFKIKINEPTASKISRLKQLEDPDFYLVLSGDDSPLGPKKGKKTDTELDKVKEDLSAVLTDPEIKQLLNKKRTGLLAEICTHVTKIDSQKSIIESKDTQIGALTFKLDAMKKQYGEGPTDNPAVPVISPENESVMQAIGN